MGKDTPYSESKKQMLKGKSSTAVELIALDDFVGRVLWTQKFLDAQVYFFEKSVA